jgi:Flp pilus assembly protein TadD
MGAERRSLSTAALLVLCAFGCKSSHAFDLEPRNECGGVVPPPPCDVTPATPCLGSALPKITEQDWSQAEMDAAVAALQKGTVAVRRVDGHPPALAPECRLGGKYEAVMGEPGSGRLWVAERVLFAPSEVGRACENATHSIAALALGPQRMVALLVPLPCPGVADRRPAGGCIGSGLNGAARTRRAEEMVERWKAGFDSDPPADAFAAALEMYALAPDREDVEREYVDGDKPSIAPLRRLKLDQLGSYIEENVGFVSADLQLRGHEGGTPHFGWDRPPPFLDCFPGLFDPAVGLRAMDKGGGQCWRTEGSGPQPSPEMKAAAMKLPARGTETAPPRQQPPPPPAPPASDATLSSGDLVRQATLLMRSGDYVRAEQLLEELRQREPANARAAYDLGVIRERLGQPRRAQKEYAAALELDGTLTKASIRLARLLLADGDDAGALKVANGGLEAAPKDPDLLSSRAAALDGAGRDAEARAAYALAIKARPDDAKLHAAYGELLSEAGRHDQALTELRLGLALNDPVLLARLAVALTSERAFDDCLTAIAKALPKMDGTELLVRRGVCKDGKLDERGAAADYEAALARNNNYPPAHFYYGLNLASRDRASALAHLDRAAAIAGERGVGPDARKKAEELRGQAR